MMNAFILELNTLNTTIHAQFSIHYPIQNVSTTLLTNNYFKLHEITKSCINAHYPYVELLSLYYNQEPAASHQRDIRLIQISSTYNTM